VTDVSAPDRTISALTELHPRRLSASWAVVVGALPVGRGTRPMDDMHMAHVGSASNVLVDFDHGTTSFAFFLTLIRVR
jgi:hypothetical protein